MEFERDDSGGISVRINGWYVVTFNADGTFTRIGCISDDVGLQVDEEGRIVERDDVPLVPKTKDPKMVAAGRKAWATRQANAKARSDRGVRVNRA